MSNPQDDINKTFRSVDDDGEGFPLGTLLENRFRLIKRIGTRKVEGEQKSIGQFGIVYLAEDVQENNRKVVIKTLKDEWLYNPSEGTRKYIIKKFFQETEALNRIHHNGVISVVRSRAEHNDRPFFAVEFVEGRTLTDVLGGEQLSPERCLNLIRKIAYAIEAVHQKKVIHRDLKPDNIIIIERENQPDEIKLIDFGIACVKDSTVAQTTRFSEKDIIGTPAYISPEQLEKYDDFSGDVFSFVTIAYEIFTGKIAFPAKSFDDAKRLHRQSKEKVSALRQDISPSVDKVFVKGFSTDSHERYQSPTVFSKDVSYALRKIKPKTFLKKALTIRSISLSLVPIVLVLISVLGYFVWNQYIFIITSDGELKTPETRTSNENEPKKSSRSNLLAEKALTEISIGRLKSAENIADSALTLEYNQPLALGVKGWAKGLRGEYKSAQTDLEKAVLLDSNNLLFQARLAITYEGLKKSGLAKGTAQKALLKASPETAVDHYSYGLLLYILNNNGNSRAIDELSRAIELNPNFAIAYFNRGIMSNRSGIKDFTQAIKINPDFALAYYYRGRIYRYENNNNLAIEDFTRAIEINSSNISFFNSRAFVYEEIGESEKAELDRQKAKQLENYKTQNNN